MKTKIKKRRLLNLLIYSTVLYVINKLNIYYEVVSIKYRYEDRYLNIDMQTGFTLDYITDTKDNDLGFKEIEKDFESMSYIYKPINYFNKYIKYIKNERLTRKDESEASLLLAIKYCIYKLIGKEFKLEIKWQSFTHQ